jgi:hypothetical protein
MGIKRVPRSTAFVYDTITAESCYDALFGSSDIRAAATYTAFGVSGTKSVELGPPAADFLKTLSESTLRKARSLAPINNPMNAAHRGGKVGTYKASFKRTKRPVRQGISVAYMRVVNTAAHASIVESGKPYVRKRQVFTWTKARKSGYQRPKGSGNWVKGRLDPGGMVSTRVVHARKGKKVLERALRYTVARYRI